MISSAIIEFNDKSILNITSNFGCINYHFKTWYQLTFVQEFKDVKIFSSEIIKRI